MTRGSERFVNIRVAQRCVHPTHEANVAARKVRRLLDAMTTTGCACPCHHSLPFDHERGACPCRARRRQQQREALA